jgi:hypothetical protein
MEDKPPSESSFPIKLNILAESLTIAIPIFDNIGLIILRRD